MLTDSNSTADFSGPQAITPALRKRLQQCYEHGKKLMAQDSYDHDYAFSILSECVLNDPGSQLYLEAFLDNLHRKFNHNKRGSMLNFGGKGPFKKAVAAKDWNEVFRQGIGCLKNNPWDVPVLRAMAEACAALDYWETELRYLRNALARDPNDAEVNRHCARSLARIGQFDQAIACWHRVDEALRGDEEAQKMMSELQLDKQRIRMGLAARHAGSKPRSSSSTGGEGADGPDAGGSASGSDKERTPDDSQPRREIKLTPRQELERAIVNNPTDLDNYLDLAQLHLDEDRVGDAIHVMNRALAATGGAMPVRERLEDLELLRKRQQLAIAEKRAASEKTDEATRLAEQLRTDLVRLEVETFAARAARHPQNLELQFQLGLRLKQAEKYREAAESFRAALRLDQRQAESHLELGECLQRLKQYDKALDQYQRAVNLAKDQHRDVELLSRYRAGVLAAALQKTDLAREQFEEVIRLDAGYRDTAGRLDKLRSVRHKD